MIFVYSGCQIYVGKKVCVFCEMYGWFKHDVFLKILGTCKLDFTEISTSNVLLMCGLMCLLGVV